MESVLGCPIEEEDLPKLIGFLKRQEANGKFFSKAMQKEPVANMEDVYKRQFLSFVNHVNQEIKEKVKSNNRAPVDCFQSLFCRLTRFG